MGEHPSLPGPPASQLPTLTPGRAAKGVWGLPGGWRVLGLGPCPALVLRLKDAHACP